MSATADPQKRTYKVRIFNQTYSVASSASEAEFELIATQVDQLMHTIASRSGSSDGTRAAVMAAMHLADKLRQTERRLQAFQDEQQQALVHVGERTGYLERLLRETLELETVSDEVSAPEPHAPSAAQREAQGSSELRVAVAIDPGAEEPAAVVAEALRVSPSEVESSPQRRTRREPIATAPTLFAMDDPEEEPFPAGE